MSRLIVLVSMGLGTLPVPGPAAKGIDSLSLVGQMRIVGLQRDGPWKWSVCRVGCGVGLAGAWNARDV